MFKTIKTEIRDKGTLTKYRLVSDGYVNFVEFLKKTEVKKFLCKPIIIEEWCSVTVPFYDRIWVDTNI